MWTTDSQIRNAAKRLEIEFTELARDESLAFINKIEEKFCLAFSLAPRMFERFNDSISLRGPDVWQKLTDFVGEEPVFVFSMSSEIYKVYRFENGSEFTSVHGECANFTTYVVPTHEKYVLASTSEDTLVGAGIFDQMELWEAGINGN